MKKNEMFAKFGDLLYERRISHRIGLREISRLVGYDPSNWSKVERGIIPPPSDEKTLKQWAKALGIQENSEDYHNFVDLASIAQRIIPRTISDETVLKLLPAFFRSVRNKKPSKKERDDLIKLLRKNT